ncbi:hypothetical protein CBW46_000185 [Paenibacillus xerothermodurans]|uniref:Uncharacterized protein n=1 Tax=Paenibacillus xerothermodurans TaxID=1977292 RepID=A0A2W1NCN9_PAEXE|nr:hypothetical protein CBW46_000185 [Paenibacillus xerothermodurans]
MEQATTDTVKNFACFTLSSDKLLVFYLLTFVTTSESLCRSKLKNRCYFLNVELIIYCTRWTKGENEWRGMNNEQGRECLREVTMKNLTKFRKNKEENQ